MQNNQIFNFLDTNKKFYNVNCNLLDLLNAPVTINICHLHPGEKSEIHNHYEVELFLFIQGNGTVYLNEDSHHVQAGMGIRISEFKNHIIENTNKHEPLVFLSLYWEAHENSLQEQKKALNKNILIFSTPPTPNGDLHLGHLSGPYLGADILKRYLAHCSHNAYHATGRDDNQTYVAKKAKDLNQQPQNTADLFAAQIIDSLNTYHINLDFFIEPNKKEYKEFITQQINTLYSKGYIYEKLDEAIYDQNSNSYLHEAYIRGKCPFCLESCDGNGCEACGRPNTSTNLLDISNKTYLRTCKRLYFRLSAFKQQLRDYIKSVNISPHSQTLALNLIDSHLEDICISHPSSWGLKCQISNFEHHIIYVWFEMAFGYLWAASRLAPKNIQDINNKVDWFYNNKESSIIHFYGYDNSFYHTILFPAVYMALGYTNLPKTHIVNELLQLDNKKFSTSRNHLIYGRDLNKEIEIDHIRWYLCKIRPEFSKTNFNLSACKVQIENFFTKQLKQWESELEDLLITQFNNTYPEPGAWTSEHQHYFLTIEKFLRTAHDSYQLDSFSLSKLIDQIESFTQSSLNFLKAHRFYFESPSTYNYARTSFSLSALAYKTLAEVMLPITPNISKKMLKRIKQTQFTIHQQLTFIKNEPIHHATV